MFRIEAAIVVLERILRRILSEFRHRSTGGSSTVQLLPPLANPESFLAIESRRRAQFNMNQPECLPHKRKQQQASKKLRTSETFAREIWAHKVEPSVLPCRRQLRGKFCNE